MSLLNLKSTFPRTIPERDMGHCFLVFLFLFSITLIPPPNHKNCTVNWKIAEFLKYDETFGNWFCLLFHSWPCSGAGHHHSGGQGGHPRGQNRLLGPLFPPGSMCCFEVTKTNLRKEGLYSKGLLQGQGREHCDGAAGYCISGMLRPAELMQAL